ncbi:MAG TPA: hypothetical protein VF215_12265, partial [Thermoanaerobaculia bacterium]
MKRRISALLLLSALVVFPAAAARRRAVSPAELYPRCAMVTGNPGVTFTRNEGFTLAPFAAPPLPISYTYGVAAMVDEQDTLVAWHR